VLDLGPISINIYAWACAWILIRATYAVAQMWREPSVARVAGALGFVILGLQLGFLGILFADDPWLAPAVLYRPYARLGWLLVSILFAVEVIAMALEGRKLPVVLPSNGNRGLDLER